MKKRWTHIKNLIANPVKVMIENSKYSKTSKAKMDPKMFERFPVGKPIDALLSDDGGLMRAIIIMVIGDPGVGKTTITNDLIADIQKKYAGLRVLFISSEETLTDRLYNQSKSPKTSGTPTLLLGEEKNRSQALEEALAEGWDIVLIDSFKDVQDKVNAEHNGMTMSEAEAWLMDQMVKTAQGQNKRGIYTAFLCIQQVKKNLDFIGSNSLKHNTTAMMEIRFSKEYPGQRYVMFSKNRRCGKGVGKKLFYNFDEESQEIEYSEMPIVRDEVSTTGARTINTNGRFITNDELMLMLPSHLEFGDKKKMLDKLIKQRDAGQPIVL